MSLAEQIDFINAGFRTLWKRLRRRFGDRAVGYVKVVELTKLGTPHLHILAECPYVPQRWLSDQWNDITGNPIVDIRLVSSPAELSRYVAKYLTKNHAYDTPRRRWSQSNGYLPPVPPPELEDGELPPTWRYNGADVPDLAAYYLAQGYVESHGWLMPPSVSAMFASEAVPPP